MPSSNRLFLLYFIIGNFFGPDLKEERPRKSILQRIAEGLSTYTSDQLAGSHMKIVELEHVYYYALQKAEKSLAMKLSLLHHFFQGIIPTSANDQSAAYPQFPDLFDPQLHPRSLFKNRYKIIENIIFINDPDTSYIKPEDIERFKRLTGLENLRLDRDSARYHTSLYGSLYNVPVQEAEPVGEWPLVKSSHSSHRGKRAASTLQTEDQHVHVVESLSIVPYNALPLAQRSTSSLLTRDDNRTIGKVSPGMFFLPSCPNEEDWDRIMAAAKGGFALTGSAAMGKVGPIVGLMDICECENAYMFRVSLPGVKTNEEEFSCEVENDGKVLIKGVTTTGERTVYRFSQVFEMQSKNLCPSGDFSVAFQLPGPVNPQQFSGNFGTDGILEGIVMKRQPGD